MIFKTLYGYDFIYELATNGKIFKSINGILKELRQYDNGIGYKMVSLKINGKYKLKYVHRLIAENFIPNFKNLPEVNHIDLNKSNNDFSNLEWCDRIANITHYHKFKPLENETFRNVCYNIDFYKYNNKWRLRVRKNGARFHIGYFKTYEDAVNKQILLVLQG